MSTLPTMQPLSYLVSWLLLESPLCAHRGLTAQALQASGSSLAPDRNASAMHNRHDAKSYCTERLPGHLRGGEWPMVRFWGTGLGGGGSCMKSIKSPAGE